jgi:hypothetical protein
MSLIIPESLIDISRGRVSGAIPFNGYGEHIATGAEINIIWPNGAYVLPPSSGLQLTLSSSTANDAAAGTGIRSVRLLYLDANLAPQVEDVILNGTTGVNTVATDIRFVQCMYMLTYGSGKEADGDITADNGGNTYSQISSGRVRCESSVRMVPAGKRLIVTSFFGGCISGAGQARGVIYLASPNFDTQDYSSDSIFFPLASASFQDGSGGLTIPVPLVFTEGQILGMSFSVDKAATIVGTWFGWLEDAV